MKIRKKLAFDIFLIILSSLIQTYVIKTFIVQGNFISSGFSGLAILINKILSIYNINIGIGILILLLNIPAAIFCYKEISLRFILKSIAQITLTSFMLEFLTFQPLFKDVVLNCLIGGAVYGLAITFSIKADGSTGGTDFIALYIYNKYGKSIWSYIFLFNVLIILIFGYIFGFEYAGYSIIFQFISTQTIKHFHHNFDQITLQITTTIPEEIIEIYTKKYRHGITVTKSYGGYSKKELYLCHSVISNYELKDIVMLIKKIDPKAIINAFKTMNFYGGFYRDKIGEYRGGEENVGDYRNLENEL